MKASGSFDSRESTLTLRDGIHCKPPSAFLRGESEIRVWSIGCATGEEAYGLAMLLFGVADRLNTPPHFQIFASDLDERSISQAQGSINPTAIEADVSPERLERFFLREGDHYRIKYDIRDHGLFTITISYVTRLSPVRILFNTQ